MQAAADPEAFEKDPAGHWLAGGGWLHWCAHPRLYGVQLWGRPAEDDVRALVRSLIVELGQTAQPHVSLVDAGGVTGVDGGAFAVLNAYVQEHQARLAQQVTRLALVHPGGMEGAVVAGFYEVLDAPYPVQLFGAAEQALLWLGETEASSSQLLGELAALGSTLRGVDPLVATVRTLMAGRIAGGAAVDVDGVARALGLSERTLQRRLQEAATTWAAELLFVRLAEAQRRMLDSQAPLTAISVDVGFSSLQHFSAAFRKSTGQTPSAWRKARTPTPD